MRLAVHVRSAVCLLGRYPALAGCDLDVEDGEVVALIGPNGAGKTTVLRALAGLVPVVDGVAVVLGHDLRVDRRAVAGRVGLVGHEPGLYDDLTPLENAAFWLRATGLRPDRTGETLSRARQAFDTLGVAHRLLDVPVGRLSAGQRRRVGLAVVVARDPELWLLDEPHAGLDPEGRDLLDGLLTDASSRGRTVVVATHDLQRADAVANRMVTVAGGATNGSAEPVHVA
jgi:heme ABC exporter ATP-binding subunit CcmA